MNPYLGAARDSAIAALLLGLFVGGWHFGADSVQGKWDADRVRQADVDAAANARYRAMESTLNQQIIEAQNEATLRNKKLQAAAARTTATANGLRDDIAILRRSLPGASLAAARERADTLGELFGQCTENYAAMARIADAHASDVRTLMDAWPKGLAGVNP